MRGEIEGKIKKENILVSGGAQGARVELFAARDHLLSLFGSRSSKIGPCLLQGPHHVAQKSTNTGTSDFNTFSSKFSFVNSIIILNLLETTYGNTILSKYTLKKFLQTESYLFSCLMYFDAAIPARAPSPTATLA